MIKITDKTNCSGCEACVQACPQQCIRFEQDEEGFYYPEVDTEGCIDCGLCEDVCSELHPNEAHHPIEVLAAINKDEEVRQNSSSGGVFTLLAHQVIDVGGAVFGVRFDKEWQAVFDCAETREQVAAFRGSKYIQARVGNGFVRCKQLLDEGRQVLFSGTPCQIAALHRFLHKPYDNLVTVDFICHGVPSPKVWARYLVETVPTGNKSINSISFRDKSQGWKKYSYVAHYTEQDNSRIISYPFIDNLYMRAFVFNLILRPSCCRCPAKGGRSNSDVTIGDFWGVEHVCPNMDDDRGTSVVMIHTLKGQIALRRDSLIWAPLNYNDIIRHNPSVESSATMHPQRDKFFSTFDKAESIEAVFDFCLRPTKREIVRSVIRRLLRIIKHMVIWKRSD